MIRNLVNRWGVLPAILIFTIGSILLAFLAVFGLGALLQVTVDVFDIAVAVLITGLLVAVITSATFPWLKQSRAGEETARLFASNDPLTMTLNRNRFIEFLEIELDQKRRYGSKFSILIFDLDNFKGINDTFGYSIGNQVLRTVSKICLDQMRRSDVLARWGDDEFACLLPHTLEPGALEFAERLRTLISQVTLDTDKHQVQFTVSVGVKTLRAETDPNAILLAAAQALTDAKQQGKNKCVAAP